MRIWVDDILKRFIYRAGYPSTGTPVWEKGQRWLRIGPYVIGNTYTWDGSGKE